MSRLHSFSDDDRVLSGAREPAVPLSILENRGLRLVKDEIDEAVANPQCPRCRSTHVKDRQAPGPKHAMWRFKECQDCGLAYDTELSR